MFMVIAKKQEVTVWSDSHHSYAQFPQTACKTQKPVMSTCGSSCKSCYNNNNNNNNNIYLLQLGCYPVAVVILHVNKHEIGYY